MSGPPHVTPELLPILEASIEHNLASDCMDVYVVTQRVRGKHTCVLLPLGMPTIEQIPEGDHWVRQPAFKLDHYSAQALMNAMRKAGVRPEGDVGNTGLIGQLEARVRDHKEHLYDMRAIVGKVLGMDHEIRVSESVDPDKPTGKRSEW